MKKKIRQPFKYGIYLIEYREEKDGILKILKEKLDTFEEAQKSCDRLVEEGYFDPVIKKIG